MEEDGKTYYFGGVVCCREVSRPSFRDMSSRGRYVQEQATYPYPPVVVTDRDEDDDVVVSWNCCIHPNSNDDRVGRLSTKHSLPCHLRGYYS